MAANNTSPSKKKYYEEYKKTHRREKNKIRKIVNHLREHPNDLHSQEQIERLKAIIENNRV